MLIAIIIMVFVFIISLLLTVLNNKYKLVAGFFTVLSFVSLILSGIYFFTDYNPLDIIKSSLTSEQNKSVSKEFPKKTKSPIKVSIPNDNKKLDESNETKEDNNEQQNYIQTASLINISDKVYRTDDNNIDLTWTPIVGQENYKLKLEVDDPFSDSETVKEFTSETNSYSVNVSEIPEGTLLFASVAVYNKETSEWIYSDPINFTLY